MESYLFDQTRNDKLLSEENSFFTNTLDEDEKLPIPPEKWINEQIKQNQKHLQDMDLIIRTDFPQLQPNKKIKGIRFDTKYVEDQNEICINVSASSSSSNDNIIESVSIVQSIKNGQNDNRHLNVPNLHIEHKVHMDQSNEEVKQTSLFKKTLTEINDSRQIQEHIYPIKRQTKPQITQNFQTQVNNRSLIRKLQNKTRHNLEYNNLITYSIYFFNTQNFKELNLPERVYEAEAIKKVIKLFKEDETIDQSLLKYPNIPMAYILELRQISNDNDQNYSLEESDGFGEEIKILQHTRLKISNQNQAKIPNELEKIMKAKPDAYVIQVDDPSKIQGQYFFSIDPNQSLREVRENLILQDPIYINAEYNLMLKYECSNFPKNLLPYQLKLSDLPIQELIVTKEQLVIVEDRYKKLTFRVFIEVNKTFEDLLELIHDGTQYTKEKYRIYFRHYENEKKFEQKQGEIIRSPIVHWNAQIKTFPFYNFEILNIFYIPQKLLEDDEEYQNLQNQNLNSTLWIEQDQKHVLNKQITSSVEQRQHLSQFYTDKRNPGNNPIRLAQALTYEEFDMMKIEGGLAVPIVFGVDYFEICFRRKKQKPMNTFQKRVKNLMKNIVSRLIEYDSGAQNKKYRTIPFKNIIKIIPIIDDEKIFIEYWKNPLKRKQMILQLDVNINKDANQSKKREKIKDILNKMMLILEQRQIGLTNPVNQ